MAFGRAIERRHCIRREKRFNKLRPGVHGQGYLPSPEADEHGQHQRGSSYSKPHAIRPRHHPHRDHAAETVCRPAKDDDAAE